MGRFQPSRGKPPRGKQRRALTGAKGGGRTSFGGEKRFAQGLLEALTAPAQQDGDEIATSFTHGFHGYPARMHPAIARVVIEGLAPSSLLDPFCGSGTTLVEAMRQRAESTGIDANPLAIRLATTRTWMPGRKWIKELSIVGRRVADAAIEEVKAARRGKATRKKEKRDRPRPRPGLKGVFPPHVLAELETLASLIRDCEPELIPHLEMVLSSIIYKVSLRQSDTDASIVRRQVPRAAASRHFRERVIQLADALRATDRAAGPAPTIIAGDARELEIRPSSIDLIMTSPPYPGTYNYVDHHQLRMDFLGIDSKPFAAAELGARRHFRGATSVVEANLEQWRADTMLILSRMAQALRPDGFVCLLVGDSLAGNRAVRANVELPVLADQAGLTSVAFASQARPLLGARERAAFEGPPKREHLMLFARS